MAKIRINSIHYYAKPIVHKTSIDYPEKLWS